MKEENKFLDKITLLITIICIVVISVTGIIFLKIENKNESTIIKADDSSVIENTIDNVTANNDGYNAEIYGLININTATKEELMLLETIGEKTADAIIDYRNSHIFKTTHEITKVYGIGTKTYEKIKDKICLK